MISFKVQLDIYQGAATRPLRRQKTTVEADTPLGALRKAEDLVNLTVADNEYAAARTVSPTWDPRTAVGEVFAEAA